MRYILALFLPWLTFFTMGKPIQGILCLLLQITLIGWLPATIWSFISISNYAQKKENDRLIETVKAMNSNNTK